MVILVTASLLFVPPPANAYTVPNNASMGQGGPSLTASLVVTVAGVGDLITANVQAGFAIGGDGNIVSITDTFGSIFFQAAHNERKLNTNCTITACLIADVWAAPSLGSGADTVLVTYNESSALTAFQLYDAVGVSAFSIVGTATGTGTSSLFGTSGSVSVVAGNFADASIYNACDASSLFTAGAGYTAFGGHAPFAGDSEYGTPPGPPSSPTVFPAGCGNSQFYLEAGAVFGAIPAGTTVIVVIPCTAFQLQCWWYPFFFFGVYMVMILGMAYMAEVPNKDILGLLLESFSIASLLGVMLGIINIMFPLIITIVQVVRAIRE
jgi:hypothetical protein